MAELFKELKEGHRIFGHIGFVARDGKGNCKWIKLSDEDLLHVVCSCYYQLQSLIGFTRSDVHADDRIGKYASDDVLEFDSQENELTWQDWVYNYEGRQVLLSLSQTTFLQKVGNLA